MKRSLLCAMSVVACSVAASAQPSAAGRAARELLRFVEARFAREVGEEGIERLEPRIVRAVEAFGGDAAAAIRRVGPRAGLRAMEEHGAPAARLLAGWGDDGARVLAAEGGAGARLFARYGDEAVEFMLRHPGLGARLEGMLGGAGLRAARGLGPEAAAQLAEVAPAVRASGRAGEILAVVEKFGDRACAFIWRNKGVIFGAAALAAFLADPEPYLAGAKRLVADPLKELGAEAAKRADWTVVVVSGLVLASGLIGLRWMRRAAARASA